MVTYTRTPSTFNPNHHRATCTVCKGKSAEHPAGHPALTRWETEHRCGRYCTDPTCGCWAGQDVHEALQ